MIRQSHIPVASVDQTELPRQMAELGATWSVRIIRRRSVPIPAGLGPGVSLKG